MFLISTLSTISRVLTALVEFEDVNISISGGATLVTCNILFVNAYTGLITKSDHPEGTLMYERFQGASILGINLPLPNLAVERPLEITILTRTL